MRVGLALGGGGAKGFSHLGVIEVLEKERIPIDIIGGTSMGAVIGALYALYADAAKIESIAREFNNKSIVAELEEKFSPHREEKNNAPSPLKKTISFIKDIYTWNLKAVRKWLVDHRPFEVLFKEVFDDYCFSNCRLPFVCTAVDIVKGEEVDFQEGLLYKALLASSALPGVFPPLKIEEKILVDGGVIASIPTEAVAQRGADFIMGVSLESKKLHTNLATSADILMSVDEIRHKKIVEYCLRKADFLIEPDISRYSWADFSKISEIIDKGKEEAEKKIPSLRKLLRQRKFFFWGRDLFRKRHILT